jgi:hypothetical protein
MSTCQTTTASNHDGWTIKREAGTSLFYGAGGYITGMFGANVAIIVDGDLRNPIGSGKLASGGFQFFWCDRYRAGRL